MATNNFAPQHADHELGEFAPCAQGAARRGAPRCVGRSRAKRVRRPAERSRRRVADASAVIDEPRRPSHWWETRPCRSGPSLWKEKPRPGSSSCMEETPISRTTPSMGTRPGARRCDRARRTGLRPGSDARYADQRLGRRRSPGSRSIARTQRPASRPRSPRHSRRRRRCRQRSVRLALAPTRPALAGSSTGTWCTVPPGAPSAGRVPRTVIPVLLPCRPLPLDRGGAPRRTTGDVRGPSRGRARGVLRIAGAPTSGISGPGRQM